MFAGWFGEEKNGKDELKGRPASVTAIALILIVIGGMAVFASRGVIIDCRVIRDQMIEGFFPISYQYAMGFLGLLITIVSGVGMLKGRNWARFLYVGWNLIGFVVWFAVKSAVWFEPSARDREPIVSSLVVFAIIAFFLFRSKAREYFSPSVKR